VKSILEEDQFICFDCETTGLDKEDLIIEIALVKFTLNGIIDSFETLIDPKKEIPQESINIHHITQDMVKGKPTIETIIPTILSFIGREKIVGHGIEFDINMVDAAAKRAHIPCNLKENVFIDTLRLARVYGDSPSNSLEQLRKHFAIPEEGAHRAMNDVLVNIEVFRQLSKPYPTTKKMLEVLKNPVRMLKIPLGKYKGRAIKELPLEYLQWASRQKFDQDLLFSLRSEVNRRKKGGLFSQAANPFNAL
jgi:DNA polymerase III subunit epsilon